MPTIPQTRQLPQVDDHAEGNLHALLAPLDFDRLNTLVALHRCHSSIEVAYLLDRERGSVDKQINALNSHFKKYLGEPLAVKPPKKGTLWKFTPTGDRVARLAEETLKGWERDLQQIRAELGIEMLVGTTTFTLPLLAPLWKTFTSSVSASVHPRFLQVRTFSFQQLLLEGRIDLVLAGVPLINDEPKLASPELFLEKWGTDSLAVLTNVSSSRLPGPTVTVEDLKDTPLVIPEAGVVYDLSKSLSDAAAVEFDLGLTISDVHYGVEALRHGLLTGWMFVLSSVGDGAVSRNARPQAEPLRLLELRVEPHFRSLAVVTGLIGRKKDLESFHGGHAIQKLVSAFREFVSSQNV